MTDNKKTPQELPELIPCGYCGKLIGPGKNRKRKFCNQAEKQAAYRARRDGIPLPVTVAGKP